MALVSYSDSEGSDDETPQTSTQHDGSATATTQPPTSFAVDKSSPRKIKVKLHETMVDALSGIGASDGEPASKRQHVGKGAFSGFNSILPAPKKTNQTHNNGGPAKGQPRKMFSLKTGAERGFNRDSDAELKQLLADQHADFQALGTDVTDKEGEVPISQANASTSASMAPQIATPMMFKPLSVARKPTQKKQSTKMANETSIEARLAAYPATEESPKPMPKVNLFSISDNLPRNVQSVALTSEYQPLVYEAGEENTVEPSLDSMGEGGHSGGPGDHTGHGEVRAPPGPQSLDAIASDLNLSASDRRQLFGRKSGASNNAVNVISFNIDKEYAANEVLRASGEQIQHNPVRAPASGKHSLKQLVTMATGQKDALEESFSAGRQNKKEAGSRYGW